MLRWNIYKKFGDKIVGHLNLDKIRKILLIKDKIFLKKN